MYQVQVADHRALGRAGGAGGVKDNGDLLLAAFGGCCDLVIEHVGIGGTADVDPVAQGGNGGLAFECHLGLPVDEHAGSATMLHDIAQARAALARTHWHRDRADAGDGIHGDHDFDAVADMEDDTVALGDSEFLKACREGPGLADDLIPGQAPVFEDQCLLVAAFGASPCDHVLQR